MEMIDDEDDKDSSHYLVFKCISHVFSSYFLSLLVMISKALLHQMVKIQDVLLHRCKFWIVTFETGITSASTRWWWLWWWIKMIMTTMMITVMRNTSGNDFSLYQNTADEQYLLSQDPALRLRIPCSVLPLLDQVIMFMRWWWMMILCAAHLCTCVYLCMRLYLCVCECVFVIFTLLSHTEVKSHMSQDRSGSCIVVQGIYLKRATSIQESTQKIR